MAIENEGATAVVEEQTVPAVEVAPQEKSMDDTIRETMQSLKERGADIPAETPEAPEEKAQRIRDEQGKFSPLTRNIVTSRPSRLICPRFYRRDRPKTSGMPMSKPYGPTPRPAPQHLQNSKPRQGGGNPESTSGTPGCERQHTRASVHAGIPAHRFYGRHHPGDSAVNPAARLTTL
jgi:hypothetical protein